jgi:hypothetical protein
MRLQPLTADEADALIRDEVPGDLRQRIARAGGGNPLFISEMLAMARERADVEVPPTLRALLAARLDQLDEPERRVLERGSVEGELFHRGAVQALAPEEQQVTARLTALVRRELVRPDRAELVGEDAFRFRHLLIRDAAYDALPKSVRAELHERFADGSTGTAGSSSWTRSSATTSSRRSPTAGSSDERRRTWRRVRASGSPPPAGERCGAKTAARRRGCSSAR